MGAGLRRATLEALCSNGPWFTKGRLLDVADLRAVYAFIQSGAPWGSPEARLLVDAGNRQKPRLKFALQLLRKSSLIVFEHTTWRAVGTPE